MSWRAALLAVLASIVHAQSLPMPSGIVHGGFVSATSHEITVRDARSSIYSCSYDARTYVERSNARIGIDDLAPGEAIEVLADRRPGSSTCYARMIESVPRTSMHRPVPLISTQPSLLSAYPDLTFSGLAVHSDGYAITLRSRFGSSEIRVRPDTRYIGDGLPLDRAALPLNTYVFIRAARNLWGEVEAYQVIWGTIVGAPEE